MENFIFEANEMGARRLPFFFIIDFEKNKPLIVPLDSCDSLGIHFNLDQKENNSHRFTSQHSFQFKSKPISFKAYEKAFNIVQNSIKFGDSYLTNLCFPTRIESDLSLSHIYLAARAKYKLLFKDQFVVFSPEAFVEIKNGKIHTFPMKGTIDANIPNARKIILADVKEAAEHATIVDFLRNDLNFVGSKVSVTKYRYLEKIKTRQRTLYQVSSKISGQLQPDFHKNIGSILDKLTPAGSISGAPKKRTIEIIREAEKKDRGYFTGIFGVFDGTNLKSAVSIRYLEKYKAHFRYWSGGGITSQSKAMDEYNEMISKVYVPIY